MERNEFIGYEYKDVLVSQDMEALYMDSFPSFGWQLENVDSGFTATGINLKFKRDRKIRNKAELARLQKEFESHIAELIKIENSKEIVSSAAAYGVGIVGTAFMAGSVFAITAAVPQTILCIILAIPGLIGWILPYFLFKRIRKNKTEKITPLIEEKYDQIYEVCNKANKLVHC